MLHECIIEKLPDEFAVQEQYLARCRCHADMFQVWQPGDPEYVCPKDRKTNDA